MGLLKKAMDLERYIASLNPFKNLYGWYLFIKLRRTVPKVLEQYDTLYSILMSYCSFYLLMKSRYSNFADIKKNCFVAKYTNDSISEINHTHLNKRTVYFEVMVNGSKIYKLSLNTSDDGVVSVAIIDGDTSNHFDVMGNSNKDKLYEIYDAIKVDLINFLEIAKKGGSVR